MRRIWSAGGRRPRARRARSSAIAAAVVLAGLLAGPVSARPDRGAGPRRRGARPDREPDPAGAEPAVATTLRVTPAAGLLDGAMAQVTGAGFTEWPVVVQCGADPRSVADCDMWASTAPRSVPTAASPSITGCSPSCSPRPGASSTAGSRASACSQLWTSRPRIPSPGRRARRCRSIRRRPCSPHRRSRSPRPLPSATARACAWTGATVDGTSRRSRRRPRIQPGPAGPGWNARQVRVSRYA
jgi:hypothetical protein